MIDHRARVPARPCVVAVLADPMSNGIGSERGHSIDDQVASLQPPESLTSEQCGNNAATILGLAGAR
jgi:hypothetical protein